MSSNGAAAATTNDVQTGASPLGHAAVELGTGAHAGNGVDGARDHADSGSSMHRRANTRYSHYNQYDEVRPKARSISQILRKPLAKLTRKVGKGCVGQSIA